jgi:glycosyltransferase involved in cell wall biosynthesis
VTKILFLGDLAGTGFGSVTKDMGQALIELGQDVRFISQNELGELPEPFASRTFSVNDPNGWLALKREGITGLLDGTIWPDGWTPEAAIILGDFYGVQEVVMATEETRKAFASIPTLHYIPVEGVDLPPTWKSLWDIVHPVAMSNFGVEQIKRILGREVPMVYHGVDTEVFRPVSQTKPLWINEKALRSKADCKKFFGGDPNTRWLLRTDRHMPRKRYASLFRSVAPVLATHPDTFLIVHCRSIDQGGNLNDTLSKYPQRIRSRILNTGFHDQAGGASRNILTALYNAADVYVSVSAEGFGLTIAEAIACGTPAVGLDYSSVPEVIGPAGLIAPIGGIVDNEWDHFWAAVDEQQYGPIVAKLLDDDILRKQLGRAGPDHVRAHFSWGKAALQFSGIIREYVSEGVAA